MTSLLQQAAFLISAMALLAGAVVVLTTHRVVAATAVLLDFLLAAGLLRLTSLDNWQGILTVALIVVIRKVAVFGMRQSAGQDRRVRPLGGG